MRNESIQSSHFHLIKTIFQFWSNRYNRSFAKYKRLAIEVDGWRKSRFESIIQPITSLFISRYVELNVYSLCYHKLNLACDQINIFLSWNWWCEVMPSCDFDVQCLGLAWKSANLLERILQRISAHFKLAPDIGSHAKWHFPVYIVVKLTKQLKCFLPKIRHWK